MVTARDPILKAVRQEINRCSMSAPIPEPVKPVKKNKHHRAVNVYANGKFYAQYSNVTECAEATGIPRNSIYRNISNKKDSVKVARVYSFKYAE